MFRFLVIVPYMVPPLEAKQASSVWPILLDYKPYPQHARFSQLNLLEHSNFYCVLQVRVTQK